MEILGWFLVALQETPHEYHSPLASSKVKERLCMGEPHPNEKLKV